VTRRDWGDLLIRVAATLGLCVALLWMVSCSRHESDQRLQEQAQQATVNAKIEARKAAAEARVAAKQAARDTKDIAAGVRAGMRTPTGPHHPVDVNSASRERLERLPGVSATTARRIEAHRPYAHARDLVRKGVISSDEYQRIAGDLTAG
jgi:DNA uptake protein ComE-like DNA-binding protein